MSNEGHFVDANVLIYAAVQVDLRHARCLKLLTDETGETLFVSSQILTEFYSVITSSRKVTSPLTPEAAADFIEVLLSSSHVVLVPILADVSTRLLSLLRRHPVRGARIFDFQIAATMLALGITKLLTFNGRDFTSIIEIATFEP